MITYNTPKSQQNRDRILALIADCALSTDAICATLKMHRSGARVYLVDMEKAGLVRVHKKQAIKNHVGMRFYWIAASAPEDAPWLEYSPPEDDIEEALQREKAKKLAAIKPFRDWTAAWIPTRAANMDREAA